jgi:hypothetical protein
MRRSTGWKCRRFTALLVLIAGCGDSAQVEVPLQKTVPVAGTVTFEGKPLVRYLVTFHPTAGGRAAGGITDEQGHFVLGTNEEGDGASPGLSKVTVIWAGPPPEEPGKETVYDNPQAAPKPPVAIPERYHDPATTDVEQMVPEDGAGDLTIDLKM